MTEKIPVWEKANLTITEAAAYFNIGENKIRSLSDDDDCTFVLWCGRKRLIKRAAFEKYLEKQFSV